jgi:TolB-like protein/Flp pilus assembly protein TadD
MADVFVSYKREDAARVGKLVAALRARGLDAWWDEDIPASAPWEATIERALNEAKAVIVCWSPASISSENVRAEARVAREDGRLVQVFVEHCTPPLFFGERQGVDLSSWRGNPEDERIQDILKAVAPMAPVRSRDASVALEPGGARKGRPLRRIAAVLALILLVSGMAGWWFLSPARAEGPATLAVLPFRALNPADANLVDAIWDDTRGAIGRNPNLRVLGRQAVEALAKQDLQPADYRRKVGADYLLDGSVQHIGDRVQMKLSLVQTRDGTEIWSDEVGGKLDDVFAFQERIASEVEGRIRGRVAPGGGTRAQNIATSGDVYALYAEATANVRKRDPDSARTAIGLLRKALAIDPNYAPAWAQLGVAIIFDRESDRPLEEMRAEATANLERALTLAPNLASAHAGLAMVRSLAPDSEPELRKALALDPGNAEAWTWLGNLLAYQNRMKEALAAQTRAVEIEPLWWTPVGNKIGLLVELDDKAGLDAELDRIRRAQDDVLLAKALWRVASVGGRPGDGVRILLKLKSDHPEESAAVDQRIAGPLIQLGFVEEGLSARHQPEFASEFRGKPASPKVLDQYPTPLEFWQDSENVAQNSRLLPNNGRLAEYLRRYHAAFKSADDFLDAFAQRQLFLVQIAPTVAANLRAGGEAAQADAILRRSEPILLQWLRNGAPTPDLEWQLAMYRAVEGQNDEATALLRRAVDGGSLPDGDGLALDIAEEPCFKGLVGRADFQAIRRRIFERLAQERAKVPQPLLAQLYPISSRAAA